MEDSQIVRQLLERGTLVFDGATGTALHAQTEDGEPIEHLCLSAPQCVLKLHQAYLAAGCQAIKTNTFAAHVSLACENEEQQREVISGGCLCGYRTGGNRNRECRGGLLRHGGSLSGSGRNMLSL